MTRVGKKKLIVLKKLTNLRRLIHTGELSLAKSQLDAKNNQIAALAKPIRENEALGQIQDYSQYQLWRQKELIRLNSESATLRASFEILQKAVGKTVAEDETVEHLTRRFELARTRQKSRKAEEKSSLHFLPNNVSNKDV